MALKMYNQVVTATEVHLKRTSNIHNETSLTAPLVQLVEGKVRGIVQHWDANSNNKNRKDQDQFKSFSAYLYEGIPYGRISGGRFEVASPAGKWPGIYEATRYRSACPQLPSARMFGRILSLLSMTNSTSEADCLLLNVWKPIKNQEKDAKLKKPKAVMVFIHGGAFETGTIFTQAYDGRYLSMVGDVIVVTVQYRLGAFGFLTAPGHVPANLGLRDQILALQWVRRNIAAFGGNPNRVTVFGESAGGSSVAALVLSPLASGLFQRAIVQSAAQGGFYSSESVEQGLAKTLKLSAKLGCHQKPLDLKNVKNLLPKVVQCLKRQPAESILAASADAFATNSLFLPVYGADSEVLPVKPEEVLKSDSKIHLPNGGLDLMFGITKNEGSMFVLALFPELASSENFKLTVNSTKTLIIRLMQHYGGSAAEGATVADFYVDRLLKKSPDANQDELRSTIGAVWGDLHLACPTMLFGQRYAERARANQISESSKSKKSKEASKQTAKLQRSFFAYQLNTPVAVPKMTTLWPSWIGTIHTTDLFYLFMAPLMRSISEPHYHLSLEMMTAWANFAKMASPGQVGDEAAKYSTKWEAAFSAEGLNSKASSFEGINAMIFEAGNNHMQKDILREVCQGFWRGKIDV